MLAYQEDQLSARDEVSLKRNVFDRIDPVTIQKYQTESEDMSVRDRLDHLKHEKERLQGKNEAESSVVPSTSSEQPARTSGPTPYLRQRLPEAVEAERRRNSSKNGPL
jgi:hypothetical protein